MERVNLRRQLFDSGPRSRDKHAIQRQSLLYSTGNLGRATTTSTSTATPAGITTTAGTTSSSIAGRNHVRGTKWPSAEHNRRHLGVVCRGGWPSW